MGTLYIKTEAGETFSLGEVGNIELSPEVGCFESKKYHIPARGIGKTFEINMKIGKRYRRIWLRMMGIGKGTNNWFKLRGGIMDRDHQIDKAMKLLRIHRRFTW